MSDWKGYVDTLMGSGICKDAAVVGIRDNKYVWAAHPGGVFAQITPAEIDVLVSKDRNSFFTNGLTIGNEKCSVLRDSLDVDSAWSMDMRTKCASGGPTYNVALSKAATVMILVKGKEGVHGGQLNPLAYGIAEHLRKCGY
ncbi:profilin-2-like [Hippocampus zosterae]|uniref:profilin-2-like n=1 Tax=Hippocampus zosterae TaxID=109293 RepID=UPI00223D1457|nr:profilin-2-like [Hippocampus zosterae]XP_051930620.1 profilin-2-like [Hippocampus zosterae]XP_051930621.1 profilin-2-like [Hippocampus zosterae]XP_051930622.1 profilin-2-like [Hippocampus zosterae]